MNVSHRQRINELLSGGKPDQLPVAFWRHFPVDDQDPDRLAAATIHFQETFEMDIIKVSPASSFCIKDWGVKDDWVGNTEGTRDYTFSPFSAPTDLKDLQVLDPYSGNLGNQLKALSILSDYFFTETPLIQTIFSPLAQLKNILGKSRLITAIRTDPKSVKKGLDVITKSTENFLKACCKIQIDGFFFAVQHASADIMSRKEFLDFGKSYDERLFPIFEDRWLNVLHMHGKNIYFDTLVDYPFQVINWHDRDTYPDLRTASSLTNKVLCGGLNRIEAMVCGSEETIKSQIDGAVYQTGMKNFILGTGCVLETITPFGNIKFALDYARSLQQK